MDPQVSFSQVSLTYMTTKIDNLTSSTTQTTASNINTLKERFIESCQKTKPVWIRI